MCKLLHMPTLLTVDNCINHSTISHQIHCLMHSPHTVTISQMPFIRVTSYIKVPDRCIKIYQNSSSLNKRLQGMS